MCRDPGFAVDWARDRFEVDGQPVGDAAKIYLMLNKPRGLVTTLSDERGRRTVFECLPRDLPFVSPVGRLDQASEGLLLFTNDTAWAASITDPANHVRKTYHVHLDRLLDQSVLERLKAGVIDGDELLAVTGIQVLRQGTKTCWVEVVLEEGKNRHIRRLCEAVGVDVLQLVRVAVGALKLGNLPKGTCRRLNGNEVQQVYPLASVCRRRKREL